METKIVSGDIVLPPEEVPAKPVDVLVYVEDVSRADAPSAVVGEQILKGVSLHSGEALSFTIEVATNNINERNLYSVRVHIDTSQSGDITIGDFVSTQSYPVLTRGYGTEVRVNVKRV